MKNKHAQALGKLSAKSIKEKMTEKEYFEFMGKKKRGKYGSVKPQSFPQVNS